MTTKDKATNERDMDEIHRELVLRVAKGDRDEHREIYNAIENE